MFELIPNAAKSKLWKHQSIALGFMVKHLSELNSPCLVRMPTGTGKTGLIACLTRLSNQESSLVLTPWAHLRNQMISDLDKAFWEKTAIRYLRAGLSLRAMSRLSRSQAGERVRDTVKLSSDVAVKRVK